MCLLFDTTDNDVYIRVRSVNYLILKVGKTSRQMRCSNNDNNKHKLVAPASILPIYIYVRTLRCTFGALTHPLRVCLLLILQCLTSSWHELGRIYSTYIYGLQTRTRQRKTNIHKQLNSEATNTKDTILSLFVSQIIYM